MAKRSGSKARACSRSACSTRSATSTASSTSTRRATFARPSLKKRRKRPRAASPRRATPFARAPKDASLPGSLRTLFFGTSAFAVPSLRVTAERTQLAGVVTQPDRKAGRGHKLTPSPVKTVALELGLPVFEPEKLRPFALELPSGFDLFALASYGRILPSQLLALPR